MAPLAGVCQVHVALRVWVRQMSAITEFPAPRRSGDNRGNRAGARVGRSAAGGQQHIGMPRLSPSITTNSGSRSHMRRGAGRAVPMLSIMWRGHVCGSCSMKRYSRSACAPSVGATGPASSAARAAESAAALPMPGGLPERPPLGGNGCGAPGKEWQKDSCWPNWPRASATNARILSPPSMLQSISLGLQGRPTTLLMSVEPSPYDVQVCIASTGIGKKENEVCTLASAMVKRIDWPVFVS